jgi:hypothetical protein
LEEDDDSSNNDTNLSVHEVANQPDDEVNNKDNNVSEKVDLDDCCHGDDKRCENGFYFIT